ncbi:hypothetical protein M0R45_027741 [Rubus argutus]|uniref:Uncharacterized protein n=1 Tax=Rubus argutus TaxID=59490 RepID=A0AAW1X182_RUBAR
MEMSNSSQSSSSRNQWSSGERLKKFSRLLLDGIKDFFKWFSPTFCCATILITLLELHVRHYWKIGFTANFLVSLGSKYSLYSIVLPLDQEIRQRITLNLSTFVSLVFADLPYVLAYVDLELCPSSRLRCFQYAYTAVFAVAVVFAIVLAVMSSVSGFAGLIIAGITNIIEKAWHGDMALHKNHPFKPLCFVFHPFSRTMSKIEKDGEKDNDCGASREVKLPF